MQQLAQSDIFFFITSIAVVIIAIALFIALIYMIRILRDVQFITRAMREASEVSNNPFSFIARLIYKIYTVKGNSRKW